MLRGGIVALVTPFYENGSVNYEKLGDLIEYQIQNGSDGIVILGTTGEASTLSFEEEEKIVKFSVAKVNHRVPLIVGAGSNETEKAVTMSKKYSSLGADYLLIITPYYNKTNETGLIKHFSMVAEAASCPIILYNVPGRTGMNIPISAIEVLSKHPNICGIKEASGNLNYATKVAKYVSSKFVMLSGNDDIIVPMMSIGASGVISVLANIAPKQVSNLVALCENNQYAEARKIQLDFFDLISDLFIEVNPIPIKAAMNYLGYSVGGYRMPLDEMEASHKEVLYKELEKMKGCF